MKAKLLLIIKAILIALVILSGSIALPVLCRPFYYWHIKPMNITDAVGLTSQQIKTAYGEMMDFCIGLRGSFSAGVLPFSASGAAHFADVRKLFILDLAAFGIASVFLIVIHCLQRKKSICHSGHTAGFWGSVGLGASFLIIGGLAASNFDRAFTLFHKLFFPGKDNWLFDYRDDPIILMLPAEFFRNCAILILAVILISCSALIVWDFKKRHTK